MNELTQGFADSTERSNPLVLGMQTDSRLVNEGDLFVALSGDNFNGLDFSDNAVSKGAVAILVDPQDAGPLHAEVPCIQIDNLRGRIGLIADRFFGEPSANIQVLGCTGTNGKTSICQYVTQAYNELNTPSGFIGTLGYGIGSDIQFTGYTTPGAVELHRILANLRYRGAKKVAIEVSSHGMAQGRVAGVRFQTAVFTNLSRDHLDYHPDMAHYGNAKRKLFRVEGLKHAIINVDDSFGRKLASEIDPGIELYRIGLDSTAAQITATNIKLSRRGIQAAIKSPWGEGILTSKLLGRFNLYNLLTVYTVLCAQGSSMAEALEALARIHTAPGRMDRFGGGGLPLVVVDFAHSPDALEVVLTTLQELCDGKLVCLFGCGGNRDQGKRPLMGEVAEELADQLIITNDNPRDELSQQIFDAILSGCKNPSHAKIEPDRSKAIRYAVAEANTNDIILVAGKGHETYQEIGATRVAFNDAEQVRQALNEKRQTMLNPVEDED